MKTLTTRIGGAVALFVGSTALSFAQVINSGGQNASGQAMGQGLLDFINLIQTIVNRAVPLLIGAAVVALMYGVLMFLFKKEAADHEKWGKFMGMAVISLFVMVSIWGLVNFLGSVLGVGQGGGVPVPEIPVRTGTY